MTQYVVSPVERVETTLAFALRLVDGFTGLEATGRTVISLDGERYPAPRNRSGWYLFLDLPLDALGGDASYRLDVESDLYFPLTMGNVAPKAMDRRSPSLSVILTPLPAYPFPAGSTLIRGMVKSEDGAPIPGATVEVRHTTVEGVTTGSGEFVLFFSGITPDDVRISGGKRLMVANNSTNLRVRVRHPDFKSHTENMQVQEGKTNPVSGPIRLKPR